MFASVLDQVTGQLDKRFLLNAFFPTLVFALLMGLIVVSGVTGIDDAITWWDEQPSVVQIVLTIGAVAAVFVVANVVAASILAITRLFEGYAFPASLFAGWAREWHHWRWERLADADSDDENKKREKRRKRQRFPEQIKGADDLAPTRLGNVLRSAELYPFIRYGVPALSTWPRLYPLLPEELRTPLDDARSAMELLLVVAFLSATLSVAGSVCLLVFGASLEWVYATLLGSAATATLAYIAALGPARIYGRLVRSAFDEHRLELLAKMRVPLPATPSEERLVWAGLARFLSGSNVDYTWRYVERES